MKAPFSSRLMSVITRRFLAYFLSKVLWDSKSINRIASSVVVARTKFVPVNSAFPL
eukprot:TRINITY_DN7055_c0_g1_i1.p2 TRINITY_DN7055_c0_g1~~TRINITY_DN7055_c0_g1_i1.p2  ORF type:complete len:56 (+),score=5.57 TRINITY_DN7055_c0_g1_i1:193-360(+)